MIRPFPRTRSGVLGPIAALVALALVPMSGNAALAQQRADAEAVAVEVTVDRAGGATRVVLTHDREAVYTIQRGRGRLRVLYSRPIAVEPAERQVDGPLLERVRERSGRSVVLDLGPEFERFESFDLRNPYRLIIDLMGSEIAVAPELPYEPDPRSRPRTVIVIDPGHGGAEHGAVGPSGLKEKDVALDIARQLKSRLQRMGRSIGVVLTRDEDRLVGLDERTATANHNDADLFISIHLNAAPRSSASGAETYYLSTAATDDEARTLAALENASGARASNGSSLDLLLWDLAQNKHLAASSKLAETIQDELNRLTGTRNRGVRQAPFRVLMGATMPAVLVEVGFITNPTEERRFHGADYRSSVVDALATAVAEFLGDLSRVSRPGGASR